jgi:hypothetical protein
MVGSGGKRRYPARRCRPRGSHGLVGRWAKEVNYTGKLEKCHSWSNTGWGGQSGSGVFGYFLRKWHFSWGLHSEKEPAMGKEEEKSSG